MSAVVDHLHVDLDRISTRAGELAVMFGVPAPRLEAGHVPEWVSEGLRASGRRQQPVLLVGPAFGALSPVQQDGALAVAMTAFHHFSAGRTKPMAAAALPTLAVGLPLAYVAGAQGVSVWLPVSAIVVLYWLSVIAAYAVWARRACYRVDREVAEVLGRPVIDLMLDLDTRTRPVHPALVWAYLAVFSPSEGRRSKRLDALNQPVTG